MADAAEKQVPPDPGGTGRTPPRTKPARRGRRRLRTAAAGCLAAGLALACTAAGVTPEAAAAPSARSETGRGSETARISVNTLTPSVPKQGDTLTLTGTVTNRGDAPITDGELALRVGPTLDSRSAIEQTAGRKGFLSGADGTEIGRHTAKPGTLKPGISSAFTLKVPVDSLGLRSDGVYQLGVSLTGRTKQQPYDQVLGMERTFLPWQRSGSADSTKLTYAWPLVAESELTARTESDEEQTPVFLNDDLADELAPGGRLQQMVSLGDELPITWVIDPDLLATVDMMTKPYRVQEAEGKTRAGRGQAYAKQWLNDLQSAVQGEEVVALPFADPDLASLAHQGRRVPDALNQLQPATELGAETVRVVLHTTARTDFAWPVNGALDSSIVDVATSAGAHNVLARSDTFPDGGLNYTASAPRPIGGGNTAVVSDAGLSKAFEGDLTEASATTEAVQRFLAHSLSVSRQVPTKNRSVVVVPQRMPTASQAQAMASALSALESDGTWTEGQSLSEAAESKPDPNAGTRLPGAGSYPRALSKKELPTSAFRQVYDTKKQLDDFEQVLTRSDRVVTPFGNAIDRAVSVSWRGRPGHAAEFRDGVQEYLESLTGEVRLIEKSDVTLSGRSATVPVTVQNNLLQRVDGLELELKPSRRIGLDVGERQPVQVDGGHSQSVKFSTSAKANGRSYVEAQLYTKDGKPYGKPMVFQVHVTSITSTVLLVIAGGVLLMVLAGVRMYTQRKRRGPAPDPDAPLDTEATGGESSSDGEPRPDATTDAADTSGEAGEEPQDGTERGRATEAEDAGRGAADTGRDDDDPPPAGERVDR